LFVIRIENGFDTVHEEVDGLLKALDRAWELSRYKAYRKLPVRVFNAFKELEFTYLSGMPANIKHEAKRTNTTLNVKRPPPRPSKTR
jgi:predicted ester cyclase